MTSAVEEAVSGNRLIKLFNSAKYETLRFSKTNQSYRRAMMRMAVAQGLQGPVSQFIVAIGIAVILTFALMQARTGGATAGDFVSFVTAMLMMISPIKHLADTNAQLQRGLASAEAVFQLIDEESEQDKGTIVLSKCLGNIAFKNVSYRYQGVERYALQNIDLDIPSGSFIAFVGPSGGGKSSLVNLLPRLYEPESGQIFLDGHPVTGIKKSSLRSHMAIVSQDIFLFNDTIAANVAYGETDPSIEKIWQALQHAELSEFVRSLPEQLETQIGDRGVRLSGGQRQRLSLARAFFKDSRILIMDEATSALDSISARKLHLILGQLRQDRTTLTIAHNLNSIEFADLICVVDKGEIVARGTHGELLAVEGLYPLLHDAHVRKGLG
jgi:subfamily B ATP-binding cassette protein MsbA